jgi:hypothetical protein
MFTFVALPLENALPPKEFFYQIVVFRVWGRPLVIWLCQHTPSLAGQFLEIKLIEHVFQEEIENLLGCFACIGPESPIFSYYLPLKTVDIVNSMLPSPYHPNTFK